MPKFSELKPSGTAHIYLDERGRGWIDDTGMRVDQVVADAIGPDRYTPEALVEAYPHLDLARIHAAMCWYYDHQTEMDAEFERGVREHQEAWERQQASPRGQKLRAAKAAWEAANATRPD